MKIRRLIGVIRAALYVMICVAVASPLETKGQGSGSSSGTDFWLMFLDNYGTSELSLTASSSYTATVMVEIPNMLWDTSVVVYDGCVNIPIPYEYGHSATAPDIGSSGIHVYSNLPITLYASNFQDASFDMSMVLPKYLLGKHYIVQTYAETSRKEIGFVATADNTLIRFELQNEADGLEAGSHYITLMAGECYKIKSRGLYDWSGTEIMSDKPIAVFQGSMCTYIGGCGACDHLYEQSLPVEYWGSDFLLVPTGGRDAGDLVKVTSSADDCQLALDNILLDTVLNKGESYIFDLPYDSVKSLTATKPVSVGLYLKGIACCSSISNGDPASVMLPPVEQGVHNVIFEAVNTNITNNHYVNIVTPSTGAHAMTIDGEDISQHFAIHPDGYSYAQLEITAGTHELNNDVGTFIAWFYGLGLAESYAYIAGSAFHDLTLNIFVNDVGAKDHPDPFAFCQGDTAHFTFKKSDSLVLTFWLIDSVFEYYGDMGYDWPATEPGLHFVQATTGTYDTLSTWILVNPVSNDTLIDTICDGLSRSWFGQELDSSGIYTDTLHSVVTGCDSVMTLDLTVVPKPSVAVDTSFDCASGLFTLSPDLGQVPGLPFAWSSLPSDTLISGHERDTLLKVNPDYTTVYTIEVEHPFCHVEGTLRLEPFNNPKAVLVVEPKRLDYDHPNFDAYDRSRLPEWRKWFVDDELMHETGPHINHFVNPTADSAVVELVIGSGRCSDTARSTVTFSHTAIWAPDVFTPGLDQNNLFFISHAECTLLELYIYDRQGRLMSHIEGSDPQWDGTTGGRPCPQGAYVWIVRYVTPDTPGGVQMARGVVTLLR